MKPLPLAVLLLAAIPAFAHTTLTSSVPASGSILPQSPERVTLSFGELTRLTSVVVTTSGGERRLAFEPTGAALEFHVGAPALANGRNELQWRALSRDGHVVSGSIILVVRPAAD